MCRHILHRSAPISRDFPRRPSVHAIGRKASATAPQRQPVLSHLRLQPNYGHGDMFLSSASEESGNRQNAMLRTLLTESTRELPCTTGTGSPPLGEPYVSRNGFNLSQISSEIL